MELKKRIGILSGIGIAVGMVIGSGLFGLPGLAIDLAGEKLALFGWIATVIIIMPLVYIFMKLGIRYPQSAGLSKYAEVALGKWGSYAVTAVLSGTFSIGIPALALIGASYLVKFLEVESEYIYIFALIFLLLSTIVNIIGISVASSINTFSIIFIFFFILMLTLFYPNYFIDGLSIIKEFSLSDIDLKSLWAVIALLFWAFLGWENLSFGLEEVKNPTKTIPLIFWGSFFIVSIFYLMLAIITSGAAVNGIEVSGTSAIASLLNNLFFGKVMIFLIVVIILANSNSWAFGASRLFYSAGKNKILPSYLGKLNKKSIPVNSLITLFMVYSIIIFASWYFKISISKIILLVSQNFIVLYLISLLAFFKEFKDLKSKIVGILALFSILFLLFGFKIAILYPLGLLLIGFIAYKINYKNQEKPIKNK